MRPNTQNKNGKVQDSHTLSEIQLRRFRDIIVLCDVSVSADRRSGIEARRERRRPHAAHVDVR